MKVDDEREQLLEIQNSGPVSHEFRHDRQDEVDALPETVQRNIETIIQLETDRGRAIPTHHRMLERVAASFGQPRFLYGQIIFFSAWWLCSHLSTLGILPKKFPKFNLRSDGLNVAALLISTGVLVYQSRQEKLAEERSHLMLQIDLLTEQKIVKLISLVEELRRDLPNVRNRQDVEAEEMQQAIDPHALLTALKESLDPDTNEPATPLEHPATPPISIDEVVPQIELPSYLG